MNKVELEVIMLRKNISAAELAQKIGMDKSTLYRKLASGKFERSEIIKIRDELELDDADTIRIFFNENSCEKRNRTKGGVNNGSESETETNAGKDHG